MKYIAIIILVFISTSCFAMDKKLSEGIKTYNETSAIVDKSREEYHKASVFYDKAFDDVGLGQQASDDEKIIARSRLNVAKEKAETAYQNLLAHEAMLAKLQPIKDEYDRQIDKQKAFNNKVADILTPIIIIFVIILAVFGIGKMQQFTKRYYDRLLKEGKITQVEYELMLRRSSEPTGNNDTNPATGLRMFGCVDSAGNPRGCSSDDYYRRRYDHN